MKVLLIRHGETVDNVAHIYAGVRDSALTNHGVLQANSLGRHLAARGLLFTDVIASDLQRAFKTAEAVRLALPGKLQRELATVATPLLRERDYGSLEGQSYTTHTQRNPSISPESDDAMMKRAEAFLEHYLIPLWLKETTSQAVTAAIVSHGIFLNVLWNCIVRRSRCLSLTTEPTYRISWDNTGFIEFEVSPPAPSPNSSKLMTAQPWLLTLQAINSVHHLTTLRRRTRGGIGSAKHDEGQKTLDGYFRKAS